MQNIDLENILKQQFPGAEIRAQDLTGGGDHWRVSLRARQFKG